MQLILLVLAVAVGDPAVFNGSLSRRLRGTMHISKVDKGCCAFKAPAAYWCGVATVPSNVGYVTHMYVLDALRLQLGYV